MFFGVHLSIHMYKKINRAKNFKCRSALSTWVMTCTLKGTLGRKRRRTSKTWEKRGSIWAGHVPDVRLNQQPPQLFPQLAPSDEQPPLRAATPQRENWSRHRSAINTHRGVQMTRFHTATHKQLSCELTSEQLLVCAHSPHTHLLVDDIHPSQASWKAEAEVTGQGEKHLKPPTHPKKMPTDVYVKRFHLKSSDSWLKQLQLKTSAEN